MSARRSTHNPRRDEPKPRSGGSGKSGSLITGLFIGLVIGLVVAAGLAWYVNNRTPVFQAVEAVTPKTEQPVKTAPVPEVKPLSAEASVQPKPEAETKATESHAPTTPVPGAAADAASSTIKPRVDYTFYGILPGDKPAKPVPLPKSKDVWWLQVAALKEPAVADKLKARLILLGLEVATQRVESGGSALYRVRVGPYKREDDALGDLDTLAANNFEPRLFKEPNTPPTAPNNKEQP